jgi:hypothetical protein
MNSWRILGDDYIWHFGKDKSMESSCGTMVVRAWGKEG